MRRAHDVAAVASRFRIPGRLVTFAPHGSGHINDTYLVEHERGGRATRHIVQRVNHEVFRDPVALMENVARVTAHVRAKLEAAGVADVHRRVLALVPGEDGAFHDRDEDGNVWRVYAFVEGARTHDTTDDARVAHAAAHAVGEFLVQLADLPGPRLHDTIEAFHDTPGRFAELRRAVGEDVRGRRAAACDEIAFARAREHMAEEFLARALPERVTHNDTKLNNVLVDEVTGEGICVIDLDTVMPGFAPFDFGEMVRSATNPVRESDRNLPGVTMRMPIFEAVVRGFLGATMDLLTREEVGALVLGAKLMALENGVRFLADHLRGDVYFRVRRPGQNLDRARVQLKLLESIERQEDAMTRVVAEINGGAGRN